jgi:adenylosuccinate lyase
VEKAITSIDGRYSEKVKELGEIFSEYALQKFRVKVECEWVLFLSKKGIIRKLRAKERRLIHNLQSGFKQKEFEEIKKIEKTTKHDVKSVEYFLGKKFEKSSLKDLREFIHFGLTSEDVTNIAHSLQLKNGLKIYLNELNKINSKLFFLARKTKNYAMLSRTHGQAASPSTFGKEVIVFLSRIIEGRKQLEKLSFPGKLNCSTGNFHPLSIAFPKKNWVNLSKEFVKLFGLEPEIYTTQVITHEKISRIFREMVGVNNSLIDLNSDFWYYISLGYLKQRVKGKEVGSSVMPHKVNPIDFENSEGNLLLANNLLSFLASQLQFSRMQRDLRDSTIKRNYGSVFGYALIGLKSLGKGLERIEADKEKMLQDLREHPEILSEAIQTILRKNKSKGAYEKLKKFSRGKKLSLEKIREFIENLELNKGDKKRLLELTPEKYTGKAKELAERGLKELKK